MKVIFKLKSVEFFDREDYISLARNIQNTWDNMKDLDAMFIPKDIEVYTVDDDSKVEVVFDGKQELGEVDTESVRHGHWVKNDNGTYSCSECQSWIPNEQHYYARYCLFCGAKMDGGENEANVEC